MPKHTFELGNDAEIVQLKGTLTILSDTHIVIGAPYGFYWPKDSIVLGEIQELAMKWIKQGGLLPIPFPVEIIDLRKQELAGKDG